MFISEHSFWGFSTINHSTEEKYTENWSLLSIKLCSCKCRMTDENKQSRETGNIGYTRRRQTIQRNWQHRVHKTKTNNPEKLDNRSEHAVSNTDCDVFVFVLCTLCCQFLWIVCLRLVYPMLPVSLDCLSSSCVPKNWKAKWLKGPRGQVNKIKCKINVRDTEGEIKNGQSRETGNIGHRKHKTKTRNTDIYGFIICSRDNKHIRTMHNRSEHAVSNTDCDVFVFVLCTLCCQLTIQRNWQHRVHKTKTNNPEKLAT
jgi:hypothetical protein